MNNFIFSYISILYTNPLNLGSVDKLMNCIKTN